MPDIPLLSIAIVSWNVRDHVRTCLQSIEHYVHLPYEVVLVDNASHDGTADMVRREFPTVRLIVNTKNVGFARGTNQALRECRGEWLALLNDDTELREDVFSPLIAFASTQSSVGAVAPELLNPDGTHQPSVRRFPHLSDQLIVLLKLRHFLWWTPVMRRYQADPGLGVRTPLDVDQVMGACMVIPRSALNEVGYLDEGYPNWFEEVDWCHRAKRHGRRIIYAPVAQLVHYGGQSFRQILSIAKHRWVLRGLFRYTGKFWPRWQIPIVWLAGGVSYLLTVVQMLIKPR